VAVRRGVSVARDRRPGRQGPLPGVDRPSAPRSVAVAELAAKVRTATGQSESDYSVLQAAYDLRKLRGKDLVAKPGRRYHVPLDAARTISAL
jgi:hypothetical protein